MRFPRSLVSGLLFIALVSPQLLPAQMSEDGMMGEASQHFKDSNGYFASTWLERLLKTYPSTRYRRDALLMLAKSYSMTKRDEKAAKYVRLLLKEFPEEGGALDSGLKKLADITTIEEKPVQTVFPAKVPDKTERTDGPVHIESVPATAVAVTIPQKQDAPAPAALLKAAALQQPTSSVRTKPPILPSEPPIPAPAKILDPPLPATPALPLVLEPRPTAAPAAATTTYYSLHAGTSVNRNKLDAILAKLTAVGIEPAVTQTKEETEVFRLLVACFPERKPAALKRAEVALHTRNSFIFIDNNAYCVAAGSLTSNESADKEIVRLAKKGVTGVNISRAIVQLSAWQVTFGRYADIHEAEQAALTFGKSDIKVRIIKNDN